MSDMKKVVRNGLVAVIYSPTWGSGWYSWHGVVELLYDPVVVGMIENKATPETIEEYCRKIYDYEWHTSCDNLEIAWIPEGTEFYINEYDGSESIKTKEKFLWLTA